MFEIPVQAGDAGLEKRGFAFEGRGLRGFPEGVKNREGLVDGAGVETPARKLIERVAGGRVAWIFHPQAVQQVFGLALGFRGGHSVEPDRAGVNREREQVCQLVRRAVGGPCAGCGRAGVRRSRGDGAGDGHDRWRDPLADAFEDGIVCSGFFGKPLEEPLENGVEDRGVGVLFEEGEQGIRGCSGISLGGDGIRQTDGGQVMAGEGLALGMVDERLKAGFRVGGASFMEQQLGLEKRGERAVCHGDELRAWHGLAGIRHALEIE